MKTGVVRVIRLLAVIAAAIVPRGARANQDPASAEPLARQVGPHCFVGTVGMPSPFLSTYALSSTGVAQTVGMKVELFDFGDPPRLLAEKQVDLVYMIQRFEYQGRVGQDLALRLALTGSGRLGTETTALLTEGVSVIGGWGAGATLRLSERPGFELAGSLDLGSNALTLISPRAFVDDVLANGLADTTSSMTDQESLFRATTGLRAAWGRSRTTGYLLFGDIGVQNPYDKNTDTEFCWQAGGAVSLDMHERWNPDLGFNLSTSYRSGAAGNEELGAGWVSGLGMFYTGRPEFMAGLQTYYSIAHQDNVDNALGAFGVNVVLRYDFR